MPFIPLVNRSAYTFYSGTTKAEALPALAAERGYEAVGLCDRDGLYAAVRFYKKATSLGLLPVLGVELTARNDLKGNSELLSTSSEEKRRRKGPKTSERYATTTASLFALARTAEGYARLCGLVSRRRLEPDRFDRIAECASATRGGAVALLASDAALLFGLKKAGADAGSLFARLGGDDPKVDGEARAAALWLDLPLVAAPESYFSSPSDFALHRLLRAVKHRPPEATPAQWLLNPDEARARFPRDAAALDLAGELAASCRVSLPLGEWLLPCPPLPAGESAEGRLRAVAYGGLAQRVRNITPGYLRRIESELRTIVRLGFAGYFLVVEELTRFARERGIPNIGRGSGASSLVSYCLFLTHVDPVRENLYFERFLNPERRNPPDIDLDFSWREREWVIRHVYETYGEESVCMIGTHNSFSMRSGFREAGKAMGVPEEELSVVARAVPHASAAGFEKALRLRPESRGSALGEGVWRELVQWAAKLDGLPRHLSVHCGGVVVSPVPLTQHLSLERSARGVAITQADMFDVEELGLVKIDLLGNRSLGVLADTVAAVRDHTGALPPVFPPERVTEEPTVAALLTQGRTMGCFYVESPGMRLLLRRLQTRTFRELTAASSIIRPGVAESGMMEAYIARSLGEEPARYLHRGLEPLLRETFGVMVYQEDVIRVAHEFVGLSLGEADLLRRAMSGKYRSKSEMEGLTASFFEKGKARGLAVTLLDELWRQIRSFAGYAFCKAHSASFAQLSCQVAYLKVHHPAEFFAALVNNQGGFYGTAAYLEEARRWGLTLCSPDVNLSEEAFAGRGARLRCGFFPLRGVRRTAMDRLYEERGEGCFQSFHDLLARTGGGLAPAEAELLIRAGACDDFGLHRGALLAQLRKSVGDTPTQGSGRAVREKFLRFPQVAEAGERYDPSPPARPLPALAQALGWHKEARTSGAADRPLSLAEILTGERRALGFCVTAHPLEPLREWAQRQGYVGARDLAARGPEFVRVWGQVITYKRIPTRRTGEAMAFATLEDPSGLTELIFFPKAYAEFGALVTGGRPLVVEGRASDDRGGITVTVNRAWAIRGVVVPRAVEDLGQEAGIG